jgi:uncharacterized membrane protein
MILAQPEKAMKPVHPLLVHFPIALLVLSVGADIVGSFADIASLRHTGWWALLGAAIGGGGTAAAGIYDMRRATLSEAVHHRVHRHMRVGIVLVGALVGLALWRWSIHSHGGELPLLYLGLAGSAVVLAGFQGWLGGELVYSDGVFVRETRHDATAATNKPDASPGGHDH